MMKSKTSGDSVSGIPTEAQVLYALLLAECLLPSEATEQGISVLTKGTHRIFMPLEEWYEVQLPILLKLEEEQPGLVLGPEIK